MKKLKRIITICFIIVIITISTSLASCAKISESNDNTSHIIAESGDQNPASVNDNEDKTNEDSTSEEATNENGDKANESGEDSEKDFLEDEKEELEETEEIEESEEFGEAESEEDTEEETENAEILDDETDADTESEIDDEADVKTDTEIEEGQNPEDNENSGNEEIYKEEVKLVFSGANSQGVEYLFDENKIIIKNFSESTAILFKCDLINVAEEYSMNIKIEIVGNVDVECEDIGITHIYIIIKSKGNFEIAITEANCEITETILVIMEE